LDYNSDSNKLERQLSIDGKSGSAVYHPVCQSVQGSRQGQRVKPSANPRSADIYLHKPKAKLLNKLPLYNKIVGQQPLSNMSDNEDASTRVSSKSQAKRNQMYSK